MKNVKDLLNANALNNLTHVVDEICPQCGGEMRAWNNGKGGNVCTHEEFVNNKLIWTGCGFRELKSKAQKEADYKYHKMKREEPFEYLRCNSITSDNNVLKRKLDTFKTDNEISRNAKEKTEIFVGELIHKEPIHILYTGVTGTGKTHLSVGLINEYLEKSNYSKKAMFINYSELYSQMQTMFQVEGAAKELEKTILTEIKKADLVVIDDLGAELGVKNQNKATATDANVRLLTRIFEAREDKNLVVTTNLTTKEITREYGERCLSRMMGHMKDENGMYRAVKTTGSVDFRMEGLS